MSLLPCTVVPGGDNIESGDAVVLIDYDVGTYPTRPYLVARADATRLDESRTVLGVSVETSTKSATAAISIATAGEAVPATITGLGGGASRVIATKFYDGNPVNQPKLARLSRIDGSEHIVGTCDENGNLSVQPRASRDTSAPHFVNVRAYGAIPDGKRIYDGAMNATSSTLTTTEPTFSADDVGKPIRVLGAGTAGAPLNTTISAFGSATSVTLAAATPAVVNLSRLSAMIWTTDNEASIEAAIAAVPASGGVLWFPGPGSYVIEDDVTFTENVQLAFEEGASLAPMNAVTATIEGRVTCHASQSVFDGVGTYVLPDGFDGYTVRNFGARPGNAYYAPRNDYAFAKAIASTVTSNFPQAIGVPLGVYSLADDLVIDRQVKLHGTARQGRSTLELAAATGIRVTIDGTDSEIAELYVRGTDDPEGWNEGQNITAEDEPAGGNPGIVSNGRLVLTKVFVTGFSGTGIILSGDGNDANANSSQIIDCGVNDCGGHGIDIGASDSSDCLVSGCKFFSNQGTGIWEHSLGSNVYIACLSEFNFRFCIVAGIDTGEPLGTNQSVFMGCHAEHGVSGERVKLRGGTGWYGGVVSSPPIGEPAIDAYAPAFVIQNAENVGTMRFSAFTTSPYVSNDQRVDFVAGGDPARLDIAFQFLAGDDSGGDFIMQRVAAAKAWSLQRGNDVAFFLTSASPFGTDHDRGVGVFGVRELLIGEFTATNNTRIQRASAPPGAAPDDPHAGDLILDTAPTETGYVGWVYTGAGWQRFGAVRAPTLVDPTGVVDPGAKVIVTVNPGNDVLLPTAPVDGDEVTVMVMNGAAASVDVNAGVETIYDTGISTDTRDDGDAFTYRWVDDLSAWKRI